MNEEKFNTFLEKAGISYLKPYQELIIRHIIENEEEGRKTRLLAVLPTGSGKSLCFMLPLLAIGGIGICVYPLLSLLSDQERRFNKLGINSITLKGGMTGEERKEKLKELEKKNRGVILTNMEMLEYMYKTNEIKLIKDKIKAVILDEVHTSITWGDSFRPSYQTLGDILKNLKVKHILAFTATIDKKVGDEIIEKIFLGIRPYIVKASSDRENIFYHSVRSINKKMDCLKILEKKSSRPAVIFSPSRELCEEYSLFLSSFFDTHFYHAGLEKEERKKIEEWFFSSKSGVLCATNAYGMGVDKEDIRTVIHITLPSSPLSFLQESGRCGRDGREAESFVLYNKESETPLSYIFKGKKCIRASLLKEMNENVETEGCSLCSNCIDDYYISSGEREILSLLCFYPFISRESLYDKLTSLSPLFIKYHLKKWEYEAFSSSLSILEFFGYIKRYKNLLKITKMGRERAKKLKEKYKKGKLFFKESKLRKI